MDSILNQIARFLSWASDKVHSQIVYIHLPRLNRRENVLRLSLAFVFLIFLVPSSMESNFGLGISFLLAALIALWNGWIYRERGAMVLVFVGSMFGSAANSLLMDAWHAFKTGNNSDVLAILFVAGLIYYMAREFKRGRRPRF